MSWLNCNHRNLHIRIRDMKTNLPFATLLGAALWGAAASLSAQVSADPNPPSSPESLPRPRATRPLESPRTGPLPDRGPRPFRGPNGPGNPRPQDGDYDSLNDRGMRLGDEPWGLPPGRMESRTFVVGAAKLDAKTLAAMEEDLVVMAHLLEKTLIHELGQPASSAMGISVIARGNSRVTQSLYLDGYGVVFQIGVAFPLVPTTTPSPEEERPVAKVSPWEEAHREVFGPRERADAWLGSPPFGRRQPQYQPERVETLKRDLLEALKNAANIRNLKPDECIAIMVTGPETQAGWRPGRRVGGELRGATPEDRAGGDAPRGNIPPAGPTAWPSTPHQAVLSIRVRRADVESLAQGKLSAEEFRRKAAINVN